MTRELSGDFITDHPFVSTLIGFGALGLIHGISNLSAAPRYETEEKERRKGAYRRRFMEQNPFNAPKITPENLRSFFIGSYEYFYSDEILVDEMVSRWNVKHPGRFSRIEEDLDFDRKVEALCNTWAKHNNFEYVKQRAWNRYLEWVDDQLFLEGLI